MSQTKVQLINAKQTFDTSGVDNVGVITASSFSGDGSQLVGVGVGTTASVNTTGIITAVSFSGDGSGLSGVGFGTEDSGSTTGIITASKFSGSGIGLTNIGGPVAGLVYSPAIGATSVDVRTNIEIVFSKPIQANTGTITLRENAVDGTIAESFNIESSSALTIDAAKLIINPTSNLSGFTTYYVVVPAETVKDTYAGISSNVGISSYYFQTVNQEFKLFLAGNNSQGQLGQNDLTLSSSPRQIPGTSWGTISMTYATVYATKTDGTLWAWQKNTSGELGQNETTTQYRSSPVQIPGTTWVTELPSNGYSASGSCLKSDGTLWMWGDNGTGRAGVNDVAPRSSPIQVPGTQWTIDGGNGSIKNIGGSLFTKTDGTLWSWGANGSGQLGLSGANSDTKSSPHQIPGTQWVNPQGGYYTCSCFKTDGTLWMWGGDGYGKLGQNSHLAERSSPIQVPGTTWDTGRDKISGYYAFGAIKTDGTLWMWGRGTDGQIANNAIAPHSSPTQVPGTEWDKISVGTRRTILATKTDGTLWAWGYGNQGELAISNLSPHSSPTQVTGTSWNLPFAGYGVGGGIKLES
jgi:alpha-tubulin suppressor-like RCC1 family protein|tara:strand:+ start:1508 stop:3238 length:1731 start_codon:yes stop_codon:yes gene_type:complete